MAKLYFKYGAMGSSKTAQALMTRFNYIEKGYNVLLMKPEVDTRSGVATVGSRIGLSAEAVVIQKDASIMEIWKKYCLENKVLPNVVIVDECQFLSGEQIDELRIICSTQDIPVFCFGLRTDFKTRLFEGSKRLFEIADSISEIKSICKCGNKAIVNTRIDEKGKVITSGKQIEIGGNERYEALCWNCYKKRCKNG